MEAVKGFLAPLGLTSSIQDTLKLVVIGGTVETARRVSVSAWNGFVDSFYLTAHFSQDDYPYDWLMHWLSKQPEWSRTREFDVTTCSVGPGQLDQSTAGDLGDEGGERTLEDGRCKREVTFKPNPDTTHTVFYHGHWLKITHTRSYQDFGNYRTLKISVVAHNNDILKRLVLEAKREYEKDVEDRVHIFTADALNAYWTWNNTRSKRPMDSIVLEPAVKEMLLADCQDFLRSKDWYVSHSAFTRAQEFRGFTGIPFRRGYLLHGMPRSGKTSLINALAGELGLNICVLILSSKGMNDNTLMKLMRGVPPGCILLLEDLDAAFTHDITSTGNGGSTLSLSGLLTSLDWMEPAEGRLVFITINHVERLDPALCRPGRMDVWVNFTHATKWQAESIFKRIFLPRLQSPTERSAIYWCTRENPPRPRRRASAHAMPVFEEAEIVQLAQRFADAIPEGNLEGYLLKNKRRPRECVEEVTEWCEAEVQGAAAIFEGSK
ncbi:BCS1 N terminal-domain-containing protein [Russula vinacea]|nr:BCS1 N terminal-domain-containing protein [Russula vinacea]